ncbi:MAG: hypothetical protein JM58_09645 [Peptococcaceae bacterium BICA1-8]|nr:MAG: hypothetical protein JM58_09645 [Peptococcaceae bacterium BICA1-8]
MNQLIKIEANEKQGQVVSARDLYESLGMNKDFTNWFKYQAEKLGLIDGMDFTPILGESTGGRPSVDYAVTLDIAKHICMVSGGEKANEMRNYFIQVEKAWNSPEQVMARALQMAQRQMDKYLKQIEEAKPLLSFAETCLASKDSILIRELAKIASKQNITIGEKRLYRKLRDWNLIMSKSTEPYQAAIDAGYFEVVQGGKETSCGNLLFKTTRVTPKGQVYIIEKLKKEA